MKHLRGLSVLVLGLGDSGLGMATWCASQGASVRVWDSREAPPQAGALALAAPQAQLFGDLRRREAFTREAQGLPLAVVERI